MKILQSRFLIFALPLITAAALITLRVYAQSESRESYDFRSDLRIEFGKGKHAKVKVDEATFTNKLTKYSKAVPNSTAHAHDLTAKWKDTAAESAVPGGVERTDKDVTAQNTDPAPEPSASATATPTPPSRAIHVAQVVAFDTIEALQSFVNETNPTGSPSPTSKPTP